MTKLSASTLARQAAKTKNPKEAKRLRAAAAKLRREDREAKAFQASTIAELDGRKTQRTIVKKRKVRPAEKIIMGLKQALEHVRKPHPAVQQRVDRQLAELDQVANKAGYPDWRAAASVDHAPLTNQAQPGHGEVVGGYLANLADELAKLARKKGGVDTIQGRLMTLEHQTRHDAKFEARQNERKAVQAIREEMRDKSICGFIAMFDASVANNVVPPACIMSADVLHNLVDALKANGYRADGKR